MKAIVLFCFALLLCTFFLVDAKSIKAKHGVDVDEVEAEAKKQEGQVSEENEKQGNDLSKCDCDPPTQADQVKCAEKKKCTKEDMEKCQKDKKCDTSKGKESKQRYCNTKQGNHTDKAKRCDCRCAPRTNTPAGAVAQVSGNPGILAFSPISGANGAQLPRKGKESKKCCCCCHECCCEPCCCCCHECCCPCCCCCCEPCCCCHHCCHCCHCCPCCCCKKSAAFEQKDAKNPLIASANKKAEHH